MKRICVIIFLLVQIFCYTGNFNEIVIRYGNNDIPQKWEYNFEEITMYKLIINSKEIEFINLSKQNEKIIEKDYNEIIEKIFLILDKEKIVDCYNIYNKNNFISYEKPLIIEVPINLMITIDGKDHCMIGKNEFLEYLDNKYNLNMKWKTLIQI